MDRDQNDALKLIEAHSAQITEYAKRGHAAIGRGVVRIELPELLPYGETLMGTTEMVYYPLDLVRRMAATVADLDGVIRMVEMYDPATQAVVLARIRDKEPVAVTIDFPPTPLRGEAAGVH